MLTSLAQFMEDALYGPNGYYSAGHARTGTRGDYFTAPETGAAFGRLLAAIFQQWKLRLATDPFHLIEVGAGEGHLMRTIVASPQPRQTSGESPAVWRPLTPSQERENADIFLSREGEGARRAGEAYAVIERSAARREKIRELNLPIQILSDFSEMKNKPVAGVIFANELIDAFPVHRIRMNNGKLEEAYVRMGKIIIRMV